VKQPPPPTQWRQRAPYAFVSRVSLSAQVFEALLGSHTGSPGARGAAAAGALEGARAQNTEGRSQRVTTPAHIPSTPTSSSPPDPSAQFPVALFGHFPRRAAAKAGRAGVPPSQLRRKEAPRARPCPASSPLVARLVSSLGQARTRARPGHRARPLLNVWLPTHSFPQRVAARTYSTSPAQAHALVGCTASHRPWHTNERPRAQAVRTSRAKPGAHASASGYRFPAAARKARPRGHAPTQSNTGSVTTPTAQAR
jgi:hypothetical protein